MEIDAKMNLGALSSPAPVTPRSAPAADSTVADDSFDSSNALVGALQNTPDIRPEVVARGRAVIGKDGYPPPDVVKKLSNFLAQRLQSSAD